MYIAEQIINTDLSCNFNYLVVFSHWCKFGSESYVVFFFFSIFYHEAALVFFKPNIGFIFD